MNRLLIFITISYLATSNAFSQYSQTFSILDSLTTESEVSLASVVEYNEGASPLESVLPASPLAMSLARYGEYPVNHTTGVPDITIPIYNVQMGSYTLPISISYHASGIRIQDVASIVGLGWSLNAGGVISRSICGAPDLEPGTDTQYYDYLAMSSLLENAAGSDSLHIDQMINDARSSHIDMESDRYIFNFAGKTGVFRYSYRDQTYIPINYSQMSISTYSATVDGNEIQCFRIVDTNGYEYCFEKPEYSGLRSDENTTDLTAWYLTNILTPFGNIQISYQTSKDYSISSTYEEITSGQFAYYIEPDQETWGNCAFRDESRLNIWSTEYLFRSPVVSNITFNGDSINFLYRNDRQDLWETRLYRIEVKSYDGTLVKWIDLDNAHYWGNSSSNYRMLLKGLTFSDTGHYSFDYQTSAGYLPAYNTVANSHRTTFTTLRPTPDYWGFCTGRTSYSQIPRAAYQYAISQHFASSSDGFNLRNFADRTPVESYTKLGIIRSITYPTGGKSTFDFEQNAYGRGGLRISQLSNYDYNGNLLEQTSYAYAGTVTSDDPLQTMAYRAYHDCSTYPYPNYIGITDDIVCVNEPTLPLTNACGVFYNRITETSLNGDYVTYEYTSDPESATLCGYTSIGTAPQLLLPSVNDYGSINPYLLRKCSYDSEGTLLQTEEYEYESQEIRSFSPGCKLVSLVKSFSSTNHYSSSALSSQLIDCNTVRFDSIMVHSRVCLMRSKKTTEELLGVTVTERYTYDSVLHRTNLPICKEIINSDGKKFKTEYIYTFASADATCQNMANLAGIFDECVKTNFYYDNRLVKQNYYTYVSKNDWYYKNRFYTSLDGGSAVEKYRVDNYGNRGNIIKMVTLGCDVDSIVWDSREVYPLAHYKNSRLQNTFTWEPLKGISSRMLENGFTELFEYDTASRLSSVTVQKGKQVFSYGICHEESSSGIGENFVRTDTWLSDDGIQTISQYKFYDALGRSCHETTNGMGGEGKYVCNLIHYDSKGRIDWRSLTCKSDISHSETPAYDELSNMMSDSISGSYGLQISYDGLNRITAESAAGDAWVTAGKGKSTEYVTNGFGSVKLYTAPLDEISLEQNGYYPARTLIGVKETDEDGHILITFKDKLGRTVLERRVVGSSNNDTYYVYNDIGQLRYVLTPQYQHSGFKAIYAYEYRYDSRGRLVKKILPQCEFIQYWYDKADRLTFISDGRLRAKGKYRFLLYDRWGRIAVQGLCSNCVRSFIGNYAYPTASLNSYGQQIPNTGYSVNTSGLLTDPMFEIVNYYDNYSFLNNTAISSYFSGLSAGNVSYANGLQTGLLQMATDGHCLASTFEYDEKGRTIKLSDKNLLGDIEVTETSYTYSGNPSSVISSISGGVSFATATNNTYNIYNNCLQNENMTISDNSSIQFQRGFTYDGLGRLVTESRPSAVGNITYNYDIHGWISSIQSNSFKQSLHYADGVGVPCYNGDVSSMVWSNSTYQDNGAVVERGYCYTYDGLDRLTDAIYGEGSTLSEHANRYDECILSYTANGAIRRLQRRGKKQDGIYGKIDNLNIHLDGNRLDYIEDDANPLLYNGAIDFVDGTDSSSEYHYDDCGSLVSDANKGIAIIEYDNNGMPKRLQFTNGNITEYVYSATGKKLRARYRTAIPDIRVPLGGPFHNLTSSETLGTDSTDYLLGGTYWMNNGLFDRYFFDGGYLTKGVASFQPHYFNRDYLGNIREVISHTGSVEQVNNYYPFGALYCDESSDNLSLQPNKFIGKEFDRIHGLNWYDFGARMYDPVLCLIAAD